MAARRESIIDTKSSLTPRQQVAAMRAKKKEDQTASLTFKPALVSSSAKFMGENTDLAHSRFDRLYGDAKKRIEKAELATIRKSRESDFRPKITPRAQSRERSDSARYSDAGAGRASAKVIEESKKPSASFTPEITRRASSIDRSQSLQKNGERLYSTAQLYAQRQAKLKEDQAKKEAAKNTFAPKLNIPMRASSNPSSGSGASVVTPAEVSARQKKYEADRAKRRDELLKAKEERETKELQFKPKITAKAAEIVPPEGLPTTTVFERLQKVTTKDLSELQQQLDSELTFRPKLAPYVPDASSASSSASAAVDSGVGEAEGMIAKPKDVHSKLYQEGLLRAQQRQLEAEKAKQEALEKLTFHPTIPTPPSANASSTLTAANMQAHALASSGDGGIRLSFSGAGPGEASQSGTNRTSSTVFERLTSTSKAQTADMLLQVKAQMELAECTFKPTVPQAPSGLSLSSQPSSETIFDRLQKDAADHQKKLDKLEVEKEEKEKALLRAGPAIPNSSREILSAKAATTPPRPSSSDGTTPGSPSSAGRRSFSGPASVVTASPKLYPEPHPQYAFKPTIPSISHELAGKSSQPIYERLQKDAVEKEKKIGKLEAEKAEKEKGSLLSAPKIPQSSKELAAKRRASGNLAVPGFAAPVTRRQSSTVAAPSSSHDISPKSADASITAATSQTSTVSVTDGGEVEVATTAGVITEVITAVDSSSTTNTATVTTTVSSSSISYSTSESEGGDPEFVPSSSSAALPVSPPSLVSAAANVVPTSPIASSPPSPLPVPASDTPAIAVTSASASSPVAAAAAAAAAAATGAAAAATGAAAAATSTTTATANTSGAASPVPSQEAAGEGPRMSKVEELRARLAKQKAEREKLKAATTGGAPPTSSETEETF